MALRNGKEGFAHLGDEKFLGYGSAELFPAPHQMPIRDSSIMTRFDRRSMTDAHTSSHAGSASVSVRAKLNKEPSNRACMIHSICWALGRKHCACILPTSLTPCVPSFNMPFSWTNCPRRVCLRPVQPPWDKLTATTQTLGTACGAERTIENHDTVHAT